MRKSRPKMCHVGRPARRLQLQGLYARLLIAALTLLVACGPPDESKEWLDDPSARPWFRDGGWFNQGQLALDRQVKRLLRNSNYDGPPRPALGILVPHAGYGFSGETAASAYARVQVPDKVLLLTPKHHTEGEDVAIWNEGPFLIPGHALHMDREGVDDLASRFDPPLPHDRDAWLNEDNHPMEMQLPFLSYLNPDVELIPVTFTDNLHRDFKGFDLERINAWGNAVAEFVTDQKADGVDVLIVASTDLIHHQPLTLSDAQDPALMEHVEQLDVEGLHAFVTDEGVTICGEIPTAVLMSAVRQLGGSAEVVARTTSAEKTGDSESVVGYGSAVFWMDECCDI